MKDIVKYICQIVTERSKLKKDYGVALIPDGLLLALPEYNDLINTLT